MKINCMPDLKVAIRVNGRLLDIPVTIRPSSLRVSFGGPVARVAALASIFNGHITLSHIDIDLEQKALETAVAEVADVFAKTVTQRLFYGPVALTAVEMAEALSEVADGE